MDTKISANDLKNQAEQLIRDGKMPPLHEVLGAVVDSRKKYGDKIKQAQKEGK